MQLIPSVPGVKLELTIDLGMQRAMRDALVKQMAFAQANGRQTDPNYLVHSAVGIALDPRNGELLAMVSLPSFDPQLFITGTDAKAITALIKDNVRKPLLNKAIADAYPPGSTLKPFFASAGVTRGRAKDKHHVQLYEHHQYSPLHQRRLLRAKALLDIRTWHLTTWAAERHSGHYEFLRHLFLQCRAEPRD